MWEKYECEIFHDDYDYDCDPDYYENKEITQKIVWMEEMDKRSFLLELLEAGGLNDEDLLRQLGFFSLRRRTVVQFWANVNRDEV